MQRRLGPGDGFIDVGSNIGYYSLLAAQQVGPLGAVLAIEASPFIYQMLCDNVKLNTVKNVRPVNIAVGDHEGVITIYKADDGNLAASTTIVSRGFPPECEVRCATLRNIATDQELRQARIIKIDIEGAEAPILQEITQNIGIFSPDLEIVSEISVDGCASIGRSWQSLFDDFSSLGFHAYEIANDYNDLAYINRSATVPPTRLTKLPARQFDVIFSRHAAESL